MQAIDIYDINGHHVDQCEAWQLEKLLPMFVVLFGAVTWRVRSEQPAEAQEFGEWLLSI